MSKIFVSFQSIKKDNFLFTCNYIKCYRIDLKCYNFSEEFCDKNNNNNNNNLLLIRRKYLYEYIQMRLTSYIKIIIK